jgi:TRAP-type uncharacterized transport system fused permease subunit
VPALLYIASLMVTLRLRAERRNLPLVDAADIPRLDRAKLIKLGLLALAVAAIVYQILTGHSPAMAGLSGLVVLLSATLLMPGLRPSPRRLLETLTTAGHDAMRLVVSCAGIGIVIGGISATGLGIKLVQAILEAGETHLLLALVLAAVCSLIIGMGLPTAASYLMVVYVAAPAIVKLGLPLLTAHLFIFYFAVLSAITPPVAICAYAAAGIARASPMETALQALRIGAMGFLLPFLWVFSPELLLTDGDWLRSGYVMLACATSVVWLAAAGEGFLTRPLGPLARALLVALAVALVLPIDWLRGPALLASLVLAFLLWRAPLGLATAKARSERQR